MRMYTDNTETLRNAEKEIETLREQLESERQHNSVIITQRDDAIGDLSQAKEDIESLRRMVDIAIKAADDTGGEYAERGEEIESLHQRNEELVTQGAKVLLEANKATTERDEWKRKAITALTWIDKIKLGVVLEETGITIREAFIHDIHEAADEEWFEEE